LGLISGASSTAANQPASCGRRQAGLRRSRNPVSTRGNLARLWLSPTRKTYDGYEGALRPARIGGLIVLDNTLLI
jgi:hypothetical protein